jgi:hypothetical protein
VFCLVAIILWCIDRILKLEISQVSVGFLNPVIVLLQISAKHIIVTLVGEIIDHELHSPFVYLLSLQQGLETTGEGSRHVPLGAPKATHLELPSVEIEQFLAMLRFHQRNRLEELQIDIQMGVQR